MIATFGRLLLRDLRLALRQGVDAVMAVAFFVIAVALFPTRQANTTLINCCPMSATK